MTPPRKRGRFETGFNLGVRTIGKTMRKNLLAHHEKAHLKNVDRLEKKLTYIRSMGMAQAAGAGMNVTIVEGPCEERKEGGNREQHSWEQPEDRLQKDLADARERLTAYRNFIEEKASWTEVQLLVDRLIEKNEADSNMKTDVAISLDMFPDLCSRLKENITTFESVLRGEPLTTYPTNIFKTGRGNDVSSGRARELMLNLPALVQRMQFVERLAKTVRSLKRSKASMLEQRRLGRTPSDYAQNYYSMSLLPSRWFQEALQVYKAENAQYSGNYPARTEMRDILYSTEEAVILTEHGQTEMTTLGSVASDINYHLSRLGQLLSLVRLVPKVSSSACIRDCFTDVELFIHYSLTIGEQLSDFCCCDDPAELRDLYQEFLAYPVDVFQTSEKWMLLCRQVAFVVQRVFLNCLDTNLVVNSTSDGLEAGNQRQSVPLEALNGIMRNIMPYSHLGQTIYNADGLGSAKAMNIIRGDRRVLSPLGRLINLDQLAESEFTKMYRSQDISAPGGLGGGGPAVCNIQTVGQFKSVTSIYIHLLTVALTIAATVTNPEENPTTRHDDKDRNNKDQNIEHAIFEATYKMLKASTLVSEANNGTKRLKYNGALATCPGLLWFVILGYPKAEVSEDNLAENVADFPELSPYRRLFVTRGQSTYVHGLANRPPVAEPKFFGDEPGRKALFDLLSAYTQILPSMRESDSHLKSAINVDRDPNLGIDFDGGVRQVLEKHIEPMLVANSGLIKQVRADFVNKLVSAIVNGQWLQQERLKNYFMGDDSVNAGGTLVSIMNGGTQAFFRLPIKYYVRVDIVEKRMDGSKKNQTGGKNTSTSIKDVVFESVRDMHEEQMRVTKQLTELGTT